MYYYELNNNLFKFQNLYDLICNAASQIDENTYSTDFSQNFKNLAMKYTELTYLEENPDKTVNDFKTYISSLSSTEIDYLETTFIWDGVIKELDKKFETSDYAYCPAINNIIYYDKEL